MKPALKVPYDEEEQVCDAVKITRYIVFCRIPLEEDVAQPERNDP